MTKNFIIKEKTQYPYISDIDDSKVLDANLLLIINISLLILVNKHVYYKSCLHTTNGLILFI